MNIEEYLIQACKDFSKETQIFKERNAKYASDGDIFENTKKMATVCQALGINVTYKDIEWIYFVGKIVRERKVPQDENILDGINYLRRIKHAEDEV